MANHPNRSWRSRWLVDLGQNTATHQDGWVFKFRQVVRVTSVFDESCVKIPADIPTDQLVQGKDAVNLVLRLAREARCIFSEEKAKNKQSND